MIKNERDDDSRLTHCQSLHTIKILNPDKVTLYCYLGFQQLWDVNFSLRRLRMSPRTVILQSNSMVFQYIND